MKKRAQPEPPPAALSKRERQILDILYRASKATALEVQEQLPESPSYSAVRALLRILEDKGHVRHAVDGAKYVYSPAVSAERARRSALTHLMHTFFEGSASKAMLALLDSDPGTLSEDDLDRLQARLDDARRNAAKKGDEG
jgi:BlaI family transcriptional regulator, penicillinase repressor